ncbi:ABC transporter permease [Georgenia sp. SYP-B2076]|uniref:ABC transporter permease n=1 Tax=Georgenia sp. SYP-B2076 TaxID=2495881 RepID=UPI00197B0483|nr:ABC transporter permease [Georgenia sp. SYP-B2076]
MSTEAARETGTAPTGGTAPTNGAPSASPGPTAARVAAGHTTPVTSAGRRTATAARPRWIAPLSVGLLGLLVWEAAARSGAVPAFFLPAPTAVAVRLWQDLTLGGLLGYTVPTLVEALLGCLLGTVVALPLGYAVFRSRWAAAALNPYIAASQAIPAVAIAPLLVIWLGYGLLPIATLCALLVFFPILLATVHGLSTVDRNVVEAARLDGAAGWALLRTIQLPLALPSLLTGLRNGFTLSITGAVVGEFVMGGEGLGQVLSVRGGSSDTTGLFSALLVLCALAMAIFGLLRAVERHLERR